MEEHPESEELKATVQRVYAYDPSKKAAYHFKRLVRKNIIKKSKRELPPQYIQARIDKAYEMIDKYWAECKAEAKQRRKDNAERVRKAREAEEEK